MKPSKSSLFLMELIISILFFSIASAVCIQLFVKAHLLNVRAQEKNETVVWVQNLAELWNSCDGDMLFMEAQLRRDYQCKDNAVSLDSGETGALSLYFNQDWELSETESAYHIALSPALFDSDSRLISAEITVYRGEEAIYRLPLIHHIAKGGSIYEQ